jgi:glycosyltransferase involved in cell wall biosynthesis
VKGLAQYLTEKGYNVVVIAAVPPAAFEASPARYEDQTLKATAYAYDGIQVVGAQLKHETTLSIYAKYSEALTESWKNCIRTLFPGYAWFAVHLHGYTGLINTAIFEAANGISAGCKAFFSYHTPVSCPKGTLLYFNKSQCVIAPNVNTCTACVLHDRIHVPKWSARTIAAALPANLNPQLPLPTGLKIKSFIKASIHALEKLKGQTGQWFVFSGQIRQLLERAGVAAGNISLIRHGVEDRFVDEKRFNRTVESRNVFVYIGRFEKIKGFTTLLKAWLALPQSPERELRIIGENQNGNEEINALLARCKDRPDIVLLGKKNRSEIKAILSGAHCVIIPSEWVETGPLVFHEAVACGCNVIATNLGGTRELAEYFGNGCTLFNFRDEADLRNKILGFTYLNMYPWLGLALRQSTHYEQVELSYAEPAAGFGPNKEFLKKH